MKRFRFNLRPVATVRAYRESQARDAFATAVHHYVEAEEKLARVRERKSEFEAALFAGRTDRFQPALEAQTLNAYRRECLEEMECERAVIAARATMYERRDAYVDAHRRVEVIQRLEVKARASHRRTQNREEQAEFDDFAGRAAHRKLVSA